MTFLVNILGQACQAAFGFLVTPLIDMFDPIINQMLISVTVPLAMAFIIDLTKQELGDALKEFVKNRWADFKTIVDF